MKQRDAFISTLFERAKNDKDIYLISVDMGAPSLDAWRKELPNQFFCAGISEQHAINFAAGLASRGKKVYVYFMASWAARCFEQIRYSCAMGNNPITILGNGIGLGYAPAGPAHEPNDDIAYMRSLLGIEVITPANSEVAKALVAVTLQERKLRYIRLERFHASEMDGVYPPNILDSQFFDDGCCCVVQKQQSQICIISSGYMLGRAIKVSHELKADVIDLFKIKNFNGEKFNKLISKYNKIITLEEQSLSGGFGSAICEQLIDSRLHIPVLRLGLPERYIFENGSREHILNTNGFSEDSIINKALSFLSCY